MRILHFWKPATWLTIILVLSLIPGNKLPGIPVFPHFDKLVHAAMYFGLAVLLVKPMSRFRLKWPYLWIILICLTIGSLVEYFQATLAISRTGSWEDELANTGGAILGVLFFHYLVKDYRWKWLF
jgi:VanZ family protein